MEKRGLAPHRLSQTLQETAVVRCLSLFRGLVHFSAHTHCDGLYVLAENMDLTP